MPWKERYTTAKGQKRYKVVSEDATGKRTSKSFALSKDADAYLLEARRQGQLGHLWEDTPDTFGSFAGIKVDMRDRVVLTGDGWFERYRPTVKRSTYDRRRSVIEHLKDLIDVRLDKMTFVLVEELVGTLQEDHPRQAKFVHETIQMILRNAKIRGQKVNPDLLTLKPPRYKPKRTRQALTPNELESLAEASDEPHLVRLLGYTGLRQGELLALRDEDIDLKASVLHVTGTVYDRERYDSPKTDKGRRTIPLIPEAVREVKLQRLKRPAGSTLLFPSRDGRYRSVRKLEQNFKTWAEAIGKDITLHDLRSTFATFMVEAKVEPDVLMELMGHADIKTTFAIYAKVRQERKTEQVSGLSTLLKPPSDSAVVAGS